MSWLWDQQSALRETWELPVVHPAHPPASHSGHNWVHLRQTRALQGAEIQHLTHYSSLFLLPELGE